MSYRYDTSAETAEKFLALRRNRRPMRICCLCGRERVQAKLALTRYTDAWVCRDGRDCEEAW